MKSRKASRRRARSFFISYAHAEQDEEALAAWLRDNLIQVGHEVFIDTDIPLGAGWGDEIERCLAQCDFFIVLLSANSIKSEMVREEVRLAHERKRRILPIRVKFTGYPGYQLNAILQSLQCIGWETEADSAKAIKAILRIAVDPSATIDSEQPVKADHLPTATDAAFVRPEPTVSRLPRGAVWLDDPLYLTRDADAEVTKLAAGSGETLLVEAPRQMGKNSLLQRYLAECHKIGS